MHRLVFAAGAATVLAVLTASPASAHVQPTAQEVPAGSYATVDFTVEHGCDGSPTVKLEFQVPEELDDVVPVAKDGWTATTAEGVVTFEGGPLPPEEEGDFSVQFTVPDTQGSTLTFPFIQTCEEGTIDWIQLGSDAERPAPTVTIGAPDPTAPTPPPTTTTTVAAETTAAPTTTVAPVAPVAGADDAEPAADPGASPWLAIVGVIVVTALVVGGVIFLRSREK